MPQPAASPLDALFAMPAAVRAKVFDVFDRHPELRQLNCKAVEAHLAGNTPLAEKLAQQACRGWYPLILEACGSEVAALFDDFDSESN